MNSSHKLLRGTDPKPAHGIKWQQSSVVKQSKPFTEKFIMAYQTSGKISSGEIRKGWRQKVLVCNTESAISSLGILPVNKMA